MPSLWTRKSVTVAVSQLDAWTDSSLNHRASAHVQVMNGLVMEDDTLQCRVSSTKPDQLVISMALSPTFPNPDMKLCYLVEKIRAVYGEDLDDETCFGILKSHPRYISCLQNLARLRGHLPEDEPLLVEFRMQAPFNIHADLVTQKEDAVFFGFEISHENGETNIWFELKENGKEFKTVTIEKLYSSSFKQTAGRAKKGMFQSQMSSIPESVSFVSPTKASRSRRQQSVASKDDNSTIKTEDQGANRMDVDDDDDESSWDSNLRDSESEEGETPEMEALRKQVAELTSIVSGLAQTKSFDSSEGSKSNLAGNLKKKKTNQGNASSSSIAGDSKASRRSTGTRGTKAREEKRKVGGSGGAGAGGDEYAKKTL
ncbi:hypothetical protein SEMRO_304_G112660.1 [Seminavis robusta]|uniref:Uncharacterized protein n=1 Tax=Seminavis robusta TaxID=568900 RepID=A0A9N8DWR1_9STRA|nr:hypothetical protein SEMRO_304_G112660.1 [Seminavis robusta]|eukprot:Sro304_g112660.1 n/a (371) ;mRNA; f:69617-70729